MSFRYWILAGFNIIGECQQVELSFKRTTLLTSTLKFNMRGSGRRTEGDKGVGTCQPHTFPFHALVLGSYELFSLSLYVCQNLEGPCPSALTLLIEPASGGVLPFLEVLEPHSLLFHVYARIWGALPIYEVWTHAASFLPFIRARFWRRFAFMAASDPLSLFPHHVIYDMRCLIPLRRSESSS